MPEPVRQPFLVCGLPKSGTTFLQRTLNLHPQISCPSEQAFKLLGSLIKQSLKEYEKFLKVVDRRTGGQGASAYGVSIENEMLAAAIATLSKSFAKGRPIHGLNDNFVFLQVARFDNILGHPKIIGIIRNPVDVGLSNWRHSRRLAREEPEHAAGHLSMLGKARSAEDYVGGTLGNYRARVDEFLTYAATHPNVLAVQYEHLVAAKAVALSRILEFLGADRDSEVIALLVAQSSREAMASGSAAPGFFGLTTNDPDKASVSREFRRAALEAAISPRMKEFGYDIAALMLGN